MRILTVAALGVVLAACRRRFDPQHRGIPMTGVGQRLRRAAAGALFAALTLVAACESTEPRIEEIVLEVGPSLVECTGVGPMMCMQVREPGEEPWGYFYSEILGFAYEPGYIWTLRVEVRPIPNPPADGSSLEYRLIEVIERVAV